MPSVIMTVGEMKQLAITLTKENARYREAFERVWEICDADGESETATMIVAIAREVLAAHLPPEESNGK